MKWNWSPFLDICLVSICGIIRAEIAFHPWANRLNQILYDYVGSQYQFNIIQNVKSAHRAAQHHLRLSFVLPYCIARRLLDMLHNVFSFQLFSSPSRALKCHDNSMWWKRRDTGALSSNLQNLYKLEYSLICNLHGFGQRFQNVSTFHICF